MRRIAFGLLTFFAGLSLLATLASFTNGDQWFVRAFDLVREPHLYLALILAVVSMLVLHGKRRMVGVVFLVVAALNFWRIWPYTSFAGEEIALSDPAQGSQCFTALALNVKMKNTDHRAVIEQIEQADADILLVMEPDARWARKLAPVLARYDTTLSEIQPNAYGMIFASRVPVRSARVVENTSRNTPTLYATLDLANGAAFEFIGLHPKPPVPGTNTQMRDENILNAGRQTPDGLANALVMGDFNDVPWSRTTTTFRKQGNWRDPRIGRGTYATFPADMTALGWPLDQIMLRGGMELRSFSVLPDNGADHRALRAEVCAGPEAN
ncbi:MAG: endonuclease/exonuclease/phosphatase family protein [Parerythrobacter sp.]